MVTRSSASVKATEASAAGRVSAGSAATTTTRSRRRWPAAEGGGAEPAHVDVDGDSRASRTDGDRELIGWPRRMLTSRTWPDLPFHTGFMGLRDGTPSRGAQRGEQFPWVSSATCAGAFGS